MSLHVPRLCYDYYHDKYEWFRRVTAQVEADAFACLDPTPTIYAAANEVVGARETLPAFAPFLLAAGSYGFYGQQSYVVGPTMLDVLSETNVRGVGWEDFRPPFPSFYVALEELDIVTPLSAASADHRLAGIFVSTWHHVADCAEEMMEMITEARNKEALLPGLHCVCWCVPGPKSANRETGLVPLAFDLAAPSPHALLTTSVSVRRVLLKEGVVKVASGVGSSWLTAFRRRVLKLAVNLCLYLACQNADVILGEADSRKRDLLTRKLSRARNARQRRKLSGRLGALSKAKVTWVGQNVAKRLKAAGYGGAPVRGRYWTPGHYMRYWVGSRTGPDGEPRKGSHTIIKWREPFCSNMDMSATFERRIRKLREPDTPNAAAEA